MPARERVPKRLPYADFFGYFLVRRQESNILLLASSAININLQHEKVPPGIPAAFWGYGRDYSPTALLVSMVATIFSILGVRMPVDFSPRHSTRF